MIAWKQKDHKKGASAPFLFDKYFMRYSEIITETYDDTLRSPTNGKLYEIFRNPSRKEFVDLLKTTEFGFARAVILENGDLLIWDAELLHDQTPFVKESVARLELSIERIDWHHALYPFDWEIVARKLGYKKAASLIAHNQYLNRLYPQFAGNLSFRDVESRKIVQAKDL